MARTVVLNLPIVVPPGVQRLFFAAAAITLSLSFWSAFVALHVIPENLLPGPIATIQAGLQQVRGGILLESTGISLMRLSTGFAMGAFIGVTLGMAMGLSPLIRTIFGPVVEIVRTIPPLAWIPLAIIWFGIGEGSKLYLIALTAFLPIVVATDKGVEQIDPVLLRAAYSLDVPRRRIMTSILLRAAMPDIATGLRLGWTLSFAILVGAEMIAANSGLGAMLMNGMNIGRFDIVIFGILYLGVLSILTDKVMTFFISRYLLHWHVGSDKAIQ
jgi:ABC-type nitrate/sulfonate/bicarbonate transport system permease component